MIWVRLGHFLIKHLTKGEPVGVYDEDNYLIDCNDYAYYCIENNKCDLLKMTNWIRI